MMASKKLTIIETKLDDRISTISVSIRDILKEMAEKYLGEKYKHFESHDIVVLLEDYIDAHNDAHEVMEALDRVNVLKKIERELRIFKIEITRL